MCSGGQDLELDNHFQPLHGTWVQEHTRLPTGGVMLRFRLSECEEGFKLIRGQTNAYTRDKCEECGFGKLALGQAIYAPLHSSRIDHCLECEDLTGVLCKGGVGVFVLHVHAKHVIAFVACLVHCRLPSATLRNCAWRDTFCTTALVYYPTGMQISPIQGFWIDPTVLYINLLLASV